MRNKVIDLEQIAAECREFGASFQTLQLATASADGVPEASYAPFVRIGRNFFVYLSELSRHNANLVDNPHASVLFIENEADAGHLFARRRLTFQCVSEEIARNTGLFERRMDDFEAKFGSLIDMLRTLEDFHLYCLSPRSGTYVAGFARAFELVGDELNDLRHINDVGHKSRDKRVKKQMDDEVDRQTDAKSA